MTTTPPRPSSGLTRLAYLIGTWFGCGRSPWAPGTVGSFGALPVHFALLTAPTHVYALVIALVCLIGTWAAQVVAVHSGKDDPGFVVVDEVAGTLLALILLRDAPWSAQAAAFLTFRLLDITKPPPIRQLEHARPPGLGIMLDDVLAGAAAGALVYWVHTSGMWG